MDRVAERRWKMRNGSAVLSGRILFWGDEPDTLCLANFRLSLPGRTRAGGAHIPNAAGATGRVARPVKYGGNNGKPWRRHYFTGRGARCLAMTEIKLGRTPHSLPRRSNSPRRNAVKTGAKSGAFRT